MSRHLIIGLGEIGGALYQILADEFNDVQVLDILDEPIVPPIDFMHIAIPYSKQFVRIVKKYKKRFNPKHTIVYSTVAIGTCNKLGSNVAHSPIEGIHPHLTNGIKIFPRWIGSTSWSTRKAVGELWERYTSIKPVNNSAYTEFLKLYSTSKYGINIAWADYADQWATKLGMDYQYVKDFDTDYNYLYHHMNRKQFRRYILDPPKGSIKGHCVVPNAKILNSQLTSPMLEEIIRMEA